MESVPARKPPNSTQSTTLLYILKITFVILLTSYFLIFGGFIYTSLVGDGRGTFNTLRSGRRLAGLTL
jgi:hypothetical protein